MSEDPEAELEPEAVAESTGDRYWSVDDYPWSAVCPNLPDDLAELLAPAVLVGALRLSNAEGRRGEGGHGEDDHAEGGRAEPASRG